MIPYSRTENLKTLDYHAEHTYIVICESTYMAGVGHLSERIFAEYHILCYPPQIFNANWDQHTIVYNPINPVIFTRYIRVLPQTWYGHISMRVEFYECDGNNS